MARTKLISLSRFWYTILIVITHLILVYFGIKQCYFHERFNWPKAYSGFRFELFFEKFSLFISLILLFIFIYPALFHIGNYANDNKQLTIHHLKHTKFSLYRTLWAHSFSLSSTLHLMMSFLILISSMLIRARQFHLGLKDSGFLWRTDLDLLFDWSPTPATAISKRFILSHTNHSSIPFSLDTYTRLSLINFLVASFICILREPNVFWSISKLFSILYSFVLFLNVLQWCLMFGSIQLLLKNVCYTLIESRPQIGYLLSNQPYTTFFLYLLLEFLVFVSSITLYYYAYNRFKFQSTDRCSSYCPSLVGIIILLLYTACKMPLVHDIFLLYIQTRIRLLFLTFIFEITHVLFILIIWIFLTTKAHWYLEATEEKYPLKIYNGLTVHNTPLEYQPTALSLPELNHREEKPYEKIRIFQSEIYYHNRPKNWSLPLNQQASMMATFDTDDDIITRSPPYPNNNETQYRNAIRKTLSNIRNSPQQAKAVFFRGNTPPVPPVKRFSKEQVEAARLRAQKLIMQQQQQQKEQRLSSALLISQV